MSDMVQDSYMNISAGDFGRYSEKENSAEKSDDKFFRGIKIFITILVGALALELVLYKFVKPSIGVPRLVFSGLKNYTEEELTATIALVYRGNWFSFDTNTIASKISAVSGIESVEIEKHFPDKISINVKERESVAMTFVTDGGRTVPVQIDKNCVLFEVESAEIAADNSIPIISGLPVEFLSGGMRIPSKYRSLIEQIKKIRELPQKYFAAVSEICVLPKKYGNYELMIIPVNSKARVLTDRVLNEDVLQYMIVALEVVNSIEPDAKQIDLRYGSVSCRTSDGGNLE